MRIFHFLILWFSDSLSSAETTIRDMIHSDSYVQRLKGISLSQREKKKLEFCLLVFKNVRRPFDRLERLIRPRIVRSILESYGFKVCHDNGRWYLPSGDGAASPGTVFSLKPKENIYRGPFWNSYGYRSIAFWR